MMPDTDGRIAANLLTGFLGSGKTSLLRRLLLSPDFHDTAVLINEFGEVGLDHLLLEEVDDDVVLLETGCICCTIRADLKEAMIRLHGRMQRGIVPPFSRLVIETTGLADPAPIVATVAADPVLRHHFRIGNVVTVVDAISGPANLAHHPEAAKQAAVADRLVISKIDLVDSEQVADLKLSLARINPTAGFVETNEDTAVGGELFTADVGSERSRAAEVARWLAAEEVRHDHHHPSHSAHAAGVRSLCITAEEPLDWAAFGLWLSMLLNRHGTRVLRVKGLLNIAGMDAPVVVHGVQHTIHPPVHLSYWPNSDMRSRIVFIVEDLDLDQLERSFRAFCRLGARATRESAPA